MSFMYLFLLFDNSCLSFELFVLPFHNFFFNCRKKNLDSCIVEIDIPHHIILSVYKLSILYLLRVLQVHFMCRSKFVVKSWNKIYLNTEEILGCVIFFLDRNIKVVLYLSNFSFTQGRLWQNKWIRRGEKFMGQNVSVKCQVSKNRCLKSTGLLLKW